MLVNNEQMYTRVANKGIYSFGMLEVDLSMKDQMISGMSENSSSMPNIMSKINIKQPKQPLQLDFDFTELTNKWRQWKERWKER